MAIQYSILVNNARLDAIEANIAATAILKIRTGSAPTNCDTADSGTVLATLTLPADWMQAASSASKAKSGTWEDASADDTGVAAHFRIYKNNGTTCGIQGTITVTSGGGDMEVDNTSFASGQSFTVSTFTLAAGNT